MKAEIARKTNAKRNNASGVYRGTLKIQSEMQSDVVAPVAQRLNDHGRREKLFGRFYSAHDIFLRAYCGILGSPI